MGLTFKATEAYGFHHAIRGMRNSWNSWELADSSWNGNKFLFGNNDLALAKTLVKAGPSHRKFMRQIAIWVDITGPLYWWKQMDKYQVGITTDSCSTMHTLSEKPIQKTDFSHPSNISDETLRMLETLRQTYLSTKKLEDWEKLNDNLPHSYLQSRTVSLSYENVVNIVAQRKNHKLKEWSDFKVWAQGLPFFRVLTEDLGLFG